MKKKEFFINYCRTKSDFVAEWITVYDTLAYLPLTSSDTPKASSTITVTDKTTSKSVYFKDSMILDDGTYNVVITLSDGTTLEYNDVIINGVVTHIDKWSKTYSVYQDATISYIRRTPTTDVSINNSCLHFVYKYYTYSYYGFNDSFKQSRNYYANKCVKQVDVIRVS